MRRAGRALLVAGIGVFALVLAPVVGAQTTVDVVVDEAEELVAPEAGEPPPVSEAVEPAVPDGAEEATATAATAAGVKKAPRSLQAADAQVELKNIAFNPKTVQITVGQTVEWVQKEDDPHTVTADDGSFDSHPNCPQSGVPATLCMQNGQTFQHAFPQEGSFAYYCRVHGGPGGSGMAGVVEVVAAAPDTGEEQEQETKDSGGGGGGGSGGDDATTDDAATEVAAGGGTLAATGGVPPVPLWTGTGLLVTGAALSWAGRRRRYE